MPSWIVSAASSVLRWIAASSDLEWDAGLQHHEPEPRRGCWIATLSGMPPQIVDATLRVMLWMAASSELRRGNWIAAPWSLVFWHRGCRFGSSMLPDRFSFGLQPHRSFIGAAGLKPCGSWSSSGLLDCDFIGDATLDRRCCITGSALDCSLIGASSRLLDCSRMNPGIGDAALGRRCCPIGSALDCSLIEASSGLLD